MKFCIECGSNNITLSIPPGDTRPRHNCRGCGLIHYQNPKVICGTLPVHDDKVLLCRRAIEPRKGFWTLPAGFMENGETTLEAAQRETMEEAEAQIEQPELYVVYNLPHLSQVYFFYHGQLQQGQYGVGEESIETRLFAESEIPWDELAFRTITHSLELYFEDRKSREFPIRVVDLQKNH